jgi:hypothetical protein
MTTGGTQAVVRIQSGSILAATALDKKRMQMFVMMMML